MCTDASKAGWGAILRDAHGRFHACGAKWLEDMQYEVNSANFDELIPHGSGIHFHIDNTAAMTMMQKCHTNSQRMHEVLKEINDACMRKGLIITASYISTQMNPADPISRDPISVWVTRANGWRRHSMLWGRWNSKKNFRTPYRRTKHYRKSQIQ
eukprot:PhF_6_TR31632/c0_g1_i1/m.46615